MVGKSKQAKAESERINTGIEGLDRLIGGGFVKDSTIMVRGDTGTGKTLFCIQYLYDGATRHNEPGIFISLSETEKSIIQHGTSLGWDLQKLIDENKLAVIRYEPHDIANILEQGGGSLQDTMDSLDAKRLAIDSLSAYEMVFESEYKMNESVLSLFELLRKWSCTTLVTSEFPVSPDKESGGRLGFLTDGIINLYHVLHNSKRMRALEVIKMRDTAHNQSLNIFTINNKGLKISGELKHVRK
jgi:circadian clock protein KaiC